MGKIGNDLLGQVVRQVIESHGPGLVTIVEGLPGGLEVSTEMLAAELARRNVATKENGKWSHATVGRILGRGT